MAKRFWSKLSITSLIGSSHHRFIFNRRIHALAARIAPLLEAGKVLDVGSGNGMLGALIMTLRTDIEVEGVDVHPRTESHIPMQLYDGNHLPYANQTFESVMIVDVLHHTDNPAQVLAECMRVSKHTVIVKDHFYRNPLEYALLRGMDWVGNAPHGVRLPYNYFTRPEWQALLDTIQAREIYLHDAVDKMYPVPFQWLLGQRIQFIAQLTHK